ncbi:hypothetical protein AMATHDRAFT_136423 [Amanita thiersii Skay4041]|uniref:SHSP domain-containing protein n=1 Tax=Amanita thiersii Skay4041 TaxID=703135 RepID=A0A2A9P096_9AGAR|nr:hypothetical protein AMATHDRAFT_136423 [Amanita thiersii Skay4041]
MSIARQFFNEVRPFFRLLEEPLTRSSALYARPSRMLLEDPFDNFLGTRPAIDVTEDGNRYVIDADLPGVKKENIEVRIGDNGRSITIEGRATERSEQTMPSEEARQEIIFVTTDKGTGETNATSEAANNGKGSQISTERFRTLNQRFSRTIWLPRVVDGSKVCAKLENGVLTVTALKSEDKGSTVVAIE